MPQSQASLLFRRGIGDSEVILIGQSADPLLVTALDIIPMEQSLLPSQSLGWHAGGQVETDLTDPSGMRAREPFFRVIAHVTPNANTRIAHGLSGQIRFQLPDEPLLPRWYRSIRQALQKRYGV